MKIALHRSLTFWAGVFVTLSIVWLWWDSMRFSSIIGVGDFSLSNQPGVLSVHGSSDPSMPAEDRFVSFSRKNFGVRWLDSPAITSLLFLRGRGGVNWQQDPREEKAFQKAFAMLISGMPRTEWVLQIPHWLAFTGSSGLFAGLLLWRARRMTNSKFQNAE